MCGIAGHLGLEADESVLHRLGACPWHSGPDGGVVAERRTSGRAGLSGAAIGSLGSRFTIALDGEVYNRLEVRRELESLGHRFTTDADHEVVLAAFVEWGANGLDRLRGAFAVAVWDEQAQRLTLARDHLGIRPLYVARADAADGGDAWVFASRIGPILDSGHHDRRPDDRTIYRYLRFGALDDGRDTFFAGISRVMPGEVVTITADGIERRLFTRLRDELAGAGASGAGHSGAAGSEAGGSGAAGSGAAGSGAAGSGAGGSGAAGGGATDNRRPPGGGVATELRARLTESVRLRLRAPGPVGTSLSGGLDSAALAAIVDGLLTGGTPSARAVGDHQQTFSAVFAGEAGDEEAHVDAVTGSARSALEAHKVSPTATEFKNDLGELVRTQEEPIASSGPYTQFRVMRAAAGRVKALLDGIGGDETLAGDAAHHLVRLRGLRADGPVAVGGELLRSADVLARRGGPRVVARLRARKRVPVEQLLDADFVSAHSSVRHVVPGTDLRARLVHDTFAGSLPARLRHTDRNARRFGIAARQPFLDVDLVRFAFGLDAAALVRDGLGKRVLRDAVREMLPASVVDRRDKVGLTTPEREWFMRLKNHIYGVFLSESFANRPYVDQSEVLHAFEGWIKGTNTVDSALIWRLLNLELWLQEYFDEKAPESPQAQRVKTDYEPNPRKQLDLRLDDGTTVRRYPLRTGLFSRDDDLDARALEPVERFFAGLPADGPEHAAVTGGPWFYFISEKIVAITQGRSFFIWDIKVGRPARVLSRYVTRTPAGIGLGSPFTMQLAIEEAGLPRVLYAAVGGGVGRLLGRRGLFYDLVGGDIRAIDGPTEYSVYPANVSAKLAPKDPDVVAARLSAGIRARVPEPYRSSFGGTVVMDANDLGRNALGTDAPGPKERYEAMFADNPLGQGSEQTPMAVVFCPPTP